MIPQRRSRNPWFGVWVLGLLLAWGGGKTARANSFLRPNFSMQFASKYVTDGFQVGSDAPVFQPWAGLRIANTGLTLGAWAALQLDRSRSVSDEVDGLLRFDRAVVTESPFGPDLDINWIYWRYPNADVLLHGNKLVLGGGLYRLPELPGAVRLTGKYHYHHWFYWQRGEVGYYQGGGRHSIEVGSKWNIGRWYQFGGFRPQLGLNWESSFHTGAFGVTPGWSHSVGSASMDWGNGLGRLSVGLHRQWSYETSVNREDEWWSTIAVSFGT